MWDRYSQRSYQLEHIDTGDYTAEEYEEFIIELQRVNRWLGDAAALRASLLAEAKRKDLQQFSVLDVGAGSGALLRVAAKWAVREGRDVKLVGLELNPRSARAIKEMSSAFSNISPARGDALMLPFGTDSFDFAFCSLFAHHLKDAQVVALFQELNRVAREAIFVIDLHRHPVAFNLYTTVGRLFIRGRLVRTDGALSILRAFKPEELRRLGEEAGLRDVKVERSFPFRLILTGRSQEGKREDSGSSESFRVETRKLNAR